MIDSKRISFEFTADSIELMDDLKKKTNTKTYATLIRDSLRFYEWMLQEKELGNEIAAVKNKKIVHVVKFLF